MKFNNTFVRIAVITAAAGMLSASPALAARSSAEGEGSQLEVYRKTKEKGPSAADKEKEAKLIAVLQSSAPAAEKAIPCKELSIYGTATAVPALAPLLKDPQLASWARIALEAIPGPEADKALRDAVSVTKGRLQQGVINSIGVRRDENAVPLLSQKLQDSDPEIIASAAVALGRIGGDDAAKALTKALGGSPEAARMYVAEGAIRCAEGFLNAKKHGKARKLYDSVRESNVPKHKMLEATRGAILARERGGIPLLMEQLRSEDKQRVSIGLRTARELPGTAVTKALAAELDKTPAEKQPLLLLALAERGDSVALPTIVSKANSGPTSLRIAAIGVLERLGNVSSVPTLLNAAVSSDKQLSQAAKNALTRLPGTEVDAALVKKLATAQGAERQTIIELAGKRQIDAALPLIKQSMNDASPAVRRASFEAIGMMGKAGDLPELLAALQKYDDSEIEAAILGVAGRAGATAAPQLTALAKHEKAEVRPIGLRALAAAGGPVSLKAIEGAITDPNEEVRDEAVRTLASWPNTWPDDQSIAEPLLELATHGRKNSHQVLALRGYLQFLQGCRDLSPEQKVKGLEKATTLVKRPEEKRLAISILQPLATPEAIEMLITFTGDEAVADDASNAIIRSINTKPQAFSRELRTKALNAVIEHAKNDSLKRRAERMRSET